jgi:peptide chain release factor 3
VPITTYINKVDREGLDPFALMDEIAFSLALEVTPVTWPIGMGGTFRGCYDLWRNLLLLPAERGGSFATAIEVEGPDDPRLEQHVPADELIAFREAVELALGAYPQFDLTSYREGHLTPIYFGSALKDFAVEALLDGLGANAPAPRRQPAEPRAVDPAEPAVTGFVFKVQANMDPNHRDRVAFLRLCSGRFRRGMKLKQPSTGKTIAVHSPVFFFAQNRALAEEAWPGDIIGIPNHGTLRVGDTLTEGEMLRFTGIPSFAPEILRRVRLDDPLKAKQLKRALEDLAEEGVTQLFRPVIGAHWIVGVVGPLQLDVLATRIGGEYGIKVGYEAAPFETARWLTAEDPAALKRFMEANRGGMADDRDGAPVFLARNAWELNYVRTHNPDIAFHATRERS